MAGLALRKAPTQLTFDDDVCVKLAAGVADIRGVKGLQEMSPNTLLARLRAPRHRPPQIAAAVRHCRCRREYRERRSPLPYWYGSLDCSSGSFVVAVSSWLRSWSQNTRIHDRQLEGSWQLWMLPSLPSSSLVHCHCSWSQIRHNNSGWWRSRCGGCCRRDVLHST